MTTMTVWVLQARLSLILALLCTPTTVASRNQSLKEWEELLLSIPKPSVLRSNLDHLTRTSHVAGTPGDYMDAHYVLSKFRSFGLEARVENVPVMLSTPRRRATLQAPDIRYQAKLAEDVVPQDVTSDDYWRNHTFNAYSPSGNVTAKLVYANFGRPQDFDALDKFGISVSGAIVLVRYGECFRGLKAMNAEERGAIGTVIYSDPQEDGFVQGATYPDGPWRPPSAVQRGSVQFNSKCAGDPYRLYLHNTSVQDVCGYESHELIPSHPVLPISYQDAAPLLKSLGGARAPSDFQGGLNFTYTLGPSWFHVNLVTDHEFHRGTIPNVVATIPGSSKKGGTIILGNHRDAWVFGAVDPNSGTTALLEVARTFSVLRKKGWRPQRTIVLASWSGEEYGLLGSTAFAELHSDLMDDTIAYLNVDEAVTGNVSLTASATHSLDRLFLDCAKVVPAPNDEQNKTLADKLNAFSSSTEKWAPPPLSTSRFNGKIGTLGSGSDYTAFLDRFGIASLDMSYKGNYGVYHSVYDSFSWMTTQGDPTFEHHRAMTQLWALMAFRLASHNVLPYHMTTQAMYLQEYVAELSEGAVALGVDLTPLEASVFKFWKAAVSIDEESLDHVHKTTSSSFLRGNSTSTFSHCIHDLNRRLAYTERRFLGSGLPRRPWFRHVLQAPGYYLGYGSQAFPGIAESIAEGNKKLAKAEVKVAAAAVANAAAYLAGHAVLSDNDASSLDLTSVNVVER